MPNPLPFPWSLSSKDTKAPGFNTTCISKSPSNPSDCSGEDCFTYEYLWGAQWLEFAALDCIGSYPTPGLVNFITNPVVPPGNVSFVVTEQCKNYYYSDWFFSVTDPWGNKWALQTSQQNITTTAGWQDNVNSVVWPEGWTVENATVPGGTEEQIPYLVGNRCFWFIMRDSNDNTWHQYTYPKAGMLQGQDLLSAIDECTPLTAAYTAEAML